MNIIFLTRFDPKNIKNWSGTPYHMYHQLKKKHHIEIIGPELLGQLNFFTNGNFPKDHFLSDDRYVKVIGSLLSERINMLKGDLVFWGNLLFQPLNINIPYIYI